MIAFLWTILPLVGWNEYTLEVRIIFFQNQCILEIYLQSSRTSCCTNLFDRRRLYVSFNLFIFVVVHCVPLIILTVTNTIIYIGLKRMCEKIARGVKTELSKKRIEMERRILKSKRQSLKKNEFYLLFRLQVS